MRPAIPCPLAGQPVARRFVGVVIPSGAPASLMRHACVSPPRGPLTNMCLLTGVSQSRARQLDFNWKSCASGERKYWGSCRALLLFSN
eukprot:6897483-Pyramimonas_sp.AAC.1